MTAETLVLGRSGDLLVAEYTGTGDFGAYSIRFYLTPCCLADATGSGDGIACRSCYLPLPEIFAAKPGPLTETFEEVSTLAEFRASRPAPFSERIRFF